MGGRGICEYAGVHPSDVDVMMGTFTKSFGANGGYIAGSHEVIQALRDRSAGYYYATALSPIVACQILTAINVILGRDGTDIGAERLQALRDNSNFFRRGLIDMGLTVLGDDDSPVIPVMLYSPSKIAEFSRRLFALSIAVVTVGFPATPLLLGRVRFCISAAHTIPDLKAALKEIKEVANSVRLGN